MISYDQFDMLSLNSFKKWQEAHALLLCEETGPLPEIAQILVSLMLGALGKSAMAMARYSKRWQFLKGKIQ